MTLKSLDQSAAWILSVFITGLGFTGIYFGLNLVANKNRSQVANETSDSVRVDEHGAAKSDDGGPASAEVPGEVPGDVPLTSTASKEKPEVVKAESKQEAASKQGSFNDGLCASGRSQSPVDIEAAKNNPTLKPIQFNYKLADVTVKNTGDSIQTDFPPGNWISFNGDRYDLLQFHFHVPSEHRVGGSQYEMEVHLVHKNSHGDLAVVGVFFSNGSENKILAPVWSAIPKTKGKLEKPVKFNPAQLLPKLRKYVNYSGSLTTSPCSEGVSWIVFEQALTASAAQLDAPMKLHGYNARSAQPLYGRELSRMSK